MKKFVKLTAFALAVCMTAGVCAGCGKPAGTAAASGSSAAAAEDKTLTVYTPDSESLINAVVPNFEKDTGIKVNVITAGTGELEKRVQSEKDNPLGDVFWGADPTMLSPMKELFTEYVSKENDNMEDDHKNKMGYFSPCVADGTVILVNKDIIGDIKVEGFEDLLNPALKGKIAFCDPTNSSSAFQQLVNMLYDMGKDNDPSSQQAWDYVDKFIKNLDGKMANSSGTVHKSVADGEYPVGLSWEDPCVQYVKNGAHVEVVYPKEGTIFTEQSVQIIKNCKHPDNAKKFVDYLLSEKTQTIFGSQLTNRPLRKNVKLASYMKPFSEMNMMKKFDPQWVGSNKATMIKEYGEHYTKLQG
ncbi:extracellular solute-binding protein [Caproiciproducens galactitolivorans]|uniref:Extracellular solute-binding protein n=1 Tax=Caproiciproducens galactitolivorans TaxID=642589 RepID=A0ABT4BTU3_9FIRM|nr:extracellular solute-binding protein [Caproiciproducens galactitolivorans]MCY1713755.1 extracellular solute-binding protein [Caproiciproducens galactitolivorans]